MERLPHSWSAVWEVYRGLKRWERLAIRSVPALLLVAIVVEGSSYAAIAAWGTLLAAISTAAAALIAAGTLKNQVDRTNAERENERKDSELARRIRQGDLLMQLWNEFNSEAFRKKRRYAAAHLEDALDSTTPTPEWNSVGGVAVTDIVNFFEVVGFLTRTSALDSEVVWERFETWIVFYWRLCERRALSEREKRDDEPWIWLNFQKLVDRMADIRRSKSKEYGVPFEDYGVYSQDDEAHFLRAEKILP